MRFVICARMVLVLVMGLMVSLGSAGCSAFQPKFQTVNISSIPEGADVKVDGQSFGKAPISVQLERNKEHSIVGMYGTRSTVRQLSPKFSSTGILDVIGTVFFLFPGLGLLTPGAWELDSTQVVLQLPQ